MSKLHYITYIFLYNVRYKGRIEMSNNNNYNTNILTYNIIYTFLAINENGHLIQQYRLPDLITTIITGHKTISNTFVE